jgi:hypothetical protein
MAGTTHYDIQEVKAHGTLSYLICNERVSHAYVTILSNSENGQHEEEEDKAKNMNRRHCENCLDFGPWAYASNLI